MKDAKKALRILNKALDKACGEIGGCPYGTYMIKRHNNCSKSGCGERKQMQQCWKAVMVHDAKVAIGCGNDYFKKPRDNPGWRG